MTHSPLIKKDTPLDHPIHELLASRWSSRAIDPDKPIPKEVILQLLEAARWAPSSRNEQPWRFIIFTRENPEALAQAQSTLTEGNAWAHRAPLLILAATRTTFASNGLPNRHHQHDLGLAVENLVLQATALGLFAHQMGGFDANAAREKFHIPEDSLPLTMISIAYPGDVSLLDPKSREKENAPRTRHPISDFAFDCTWGSTFSL